MKKTNYLSTLTPLRGIAALFIVVLHAQVYAPPVVSPAVSHLLEQSFLWVDFFFILSGFILTHVYGGRFTPSVSRARFWHYIGARFARVYPLHLFTLLWTVGTVVLIRQQATAVDPFLQNTIFNYWGIPASLLFVQSLNLFTIIPFNGPSWSLSTEWWIYLLFPFLLYGLRRLSVVGKQMVLLGVAGLYVGLVYYLAPNFSSQHKATLSLMSDWGLLRCLAGFVLGMLAYEAYGQNWGRAVMKRGVFFVFAFGLTLLGLHVGVSDLLIVAIFPLVILSAAYQSGWLKRVLNTRPLQRLGDWSFSIYMVHVPIIFTFYVHWIRINPQLFAHFQLGGPANPNYAQGQVFAAMLVGLTLLVAVLTYYFVEVPTRRYLNARFSTPHPESIAVTMS